jgi:capsular exopolysaccharide synthesis family protein
MTDEPDLRRYLTVVRRQLPLVLTMTIVCALAALAVSLTQAPSYSAKATLLYAPPATQTSTDPSRDIATLVGTAKIDRILQAAAPAAGMSVQQLQQAISVAADPTANLIDVTASAGNAHAAQRAANAVAAAIQADNLAQVRKTQQAQIDVIARQIAQLRGQHTTDARTQRASLRDELNADQVQLQAAQANLQVADAAPLPTAPSSPKPLRDAAIGGIVGLLLGIGTALVRDRLDRRLRTVDEIEDAYGTSLLGTVPRVNAAARGDRSAGLGDYAGVSLLAESYRTIRTNLSLFRLDREDMKVVVISSAVAGEGKSAATANLAASLAASGRRVLAVSADIRSPALHEYFAHRGGVGVIDVLSDEATLDQAARFAPLNGNVSARAGEVSLLSNDRHFSDPAMLYQSNAMARLLDHARSTYDMVLLDAPPLLFAGEASVLARQADAVIIVSRIDQVTRDEARRARTLLQAADVKPLGLIVTNVSADGDVYYGKKDG